MAASPRLFLITPKLVDPAAFAPLLEAAMRAADIACVLIRSAEGGEQALKGLSRALAPLAQRHGAAVLAEAEPRLALRLGLDGVHLHHDAGLREAAAALQPERIVGAGSLSSRDAAMVAGESGADYLMFGDPDDATNQDAHDQICERVEWWAEIFTVPCVGYARHPDLAGDIARAGAEFVGLCGGLWDVPERIGDTLAKVSSALVPEAVR